MTLPVIFHSQAERELNEAAAYIRILAIAHHKRRPLYWRGCRWCTV
jgi:hypothetical protein